MLRVTVELVPFGDETQTKKIGEMVIGNDGTGTLNSSNYQAIITPDNWSNDPEYYVKVQGYNRSKSVWDLIETILKTKKLSFKKNESYYKKLKKKLKA